jgi:hypothetical protein
LTEIPNSNLLFPNNHRYPLNTKRETDCNIKIILIRYMALLPPRFKLYKKVINEGSHKSNINLSIYLVYHWSHWSKTDMTSSGRRSHHSFKIEQETRRWERTPSQKRRTAQRQPISFPWYLRTLRMCRLRTGMTTVNP